MVSLLLRTCLYLKSSAFLGTLLVEKCFPQTKVPVSNQYGIGFNQSVMNNMTPHRAFFVLCLWL
jgi:hypothetical protein